MTKQEVSSGVIPFTVIDDELKILSVKARTEDWEFPKGGVEGDEELQQTAIREVKEEIGVDVRILDSFATSYSYSFYWENSPVDKTVHLYLGEVFSPDTVSLSNEHSEYKWLSPEDAINQVTHTGMKSALQEALNHIEKTGKYPFSSEVAR